MYFPFDFIYFSAIIMDLYIVGAGWHFCFFASMKNASVYEMIHINIQFTAYIEFELKYYEFVI